MLYLLYYKLYYIYYIIVYFIKLTIYCIIQYIVHVCLKTYDPLASYVYSGQGFNDNITNRCELDFSYWVVGH